MKNFEIIELVTLITIFSYLNLTMMSIIYDFIYYFYLEIVKKESIITFDSKESDDLLIKWYNPFQMTMKNFFINLYGFFICIIILTDPIDMLLDLIKN